MLHVESQSENIKVTLDASQAQQAMAGAIFVDGARIELLPDGTGARVTGTAILDLIWAALNAIQPPPDGQSWANLKSATLTRNPVDGSITIQATLNMPPSNS